MLLLSPLDLLVCGQDVGRSRGERKKGEVLPRVLKVLVITFHITIISSQDLILWFGEFSTESSSLSISFTGTFCLAENQTPPHQEDLQKKGGLWLTQHM